MTPVNALGEPVDHRDPRDIRIGELEREIAGLVNMMVLLVNRAGGEVVITPIELAELTGTLTSHTTQDGVTLKVVA